MKNGYQTWGGGMKNDMFFISNNFLLGQTKNIPSTVVEGIF